MPDGPRITERLSGAARHRLRAQAGMPEVAEQLDGLRGAVDELERRIRDGQVEHAGFLDGLAAQARATLERLERFEKLERIAATTAWVRSVPPMAGTLVSVIVPTHNRSALLREAVASVLRSTHERLEVIVVDDASDDDTPAVIAELTAADARVRGHRHPENRGGGPARNTGQDLAEGTVIAYLDDDNLLGRDWLHAVAWAFGERPDVDVVYGPLLFDRADGSLVPYVQFEAWDPRRQELEGLIDQSAYAHRAGLPEARHRRCFHPDWECTTRLLAERDPLELPVVAASYRRLDIERDTATVGDEITRHRVRLQQLALRRRGLRVVGTPRTAGLLRALADAGVHAWVWGGEAEGLEPAPDDLWAGDGRRIPDAALLDVDARAGDPATLVGLGVPYAAAGPGIPSPQLGELPGAAGSGQLAAWLLNAVDRHRGRALGYPEPDGEPEPLA